MLSVVIPAYNEEDSIEAVALRVLRTRAQLRDVGVDDLELIVVDDGSTDRTREIARRVPGVRLLCHTSNGGYGAALKTGWAAARGEWIGFLDADGTYPPEYFPALCRSALEHDADIVIGTRMSGAASDMPLVRRIGNRIFAGLVSLVSAERISDSASGMRVFKKEILCRLYPLPDGLNLTPVMSTRALHEGLRMVEQPIPYNERAGRSKLSAVRDGLRFASSILWTVLTYNPVRLFGLVGAAALAVSATLGALFLLARLRGVTELGPLGVFALFLAAVLAVGGVSIFCLGASFNYLVGLFYSPAGSPGLVRQAALPPSAGASLRLAGRRSRGRRRAARTQQPCPGAAGGWPQARLWFWELLSAGTILVGLQLIVSWTIMAALAELSQRELRVAGDLRGSEAAAIPPAPENKVMAEWLNELN